MSTPTLAAVRLVEAGGLQLTLDPGGARVLRLTHGDLARLELWAESSANIEAEIRDREVELRRRRALVVEQLDRDDPGDPDVTMEDLAEGAAALKRDALALAADNRRAAAEVWRNIPAIVELWPNADDMPAVLNVRLLGEWRAAIEGDPFARSPGEPVQPAMVRVTATPPSANNSQT